MMRPFHISMNEAPTIAGPARSRQTVGNSTRRAQSLDGVAKNRISPLDLLWSKYLQQRGEATESPRRNPKNPSNPHWCPYCGRPTVLRDETSGDRAVVTTTEYVFNGDTLVSTIDQQFKSGVATGTAQKRYIHPDHLNSTNVVTDDTGSVVQTLDYYPYGATRISTNVGGVNSARKFIGQFADQSNLDYLQARYYEAARGQFLSEDPVFLAVGDPDKLQSLIGKGQLSFLADPQSMNFYNYGRGNPITNKDPEGKFVELSGTAVISGRSFSAGLRIDSTGIDYFLSGGVAIGAGGVGVAWAPGVELSHPPGATVSTFAEAAYGLGGRISSNVVSYDSETRRKMPNGDPVMALVLGGGGGAGIQGEVSAPVPHLVWGNPKPLPGSVVPSTLNNHTYISAPKQSYQTPAQSER